MKINLKLTTKKIFKYLYIILIISNLASIAIMVKFTNKYVFQTITIDRSTLVSEKNILTGDVNMEKFDNVYLKLINKKVKNDITTVVNIFN